jgi:hypothetical protein
MVSLGRGGKTGGLVLQEVSLQEAQTSLGTIIERGKGIF